MGLGCHDLRTPLATVNGFAKTLIRSGSLAERDARYLAMIDEAAGQMTAILDQLGVAARIAAGRYDPVRVEADTLELAARAGDPRIAVEGEGETVETDPETVGNALASLAGAALRFGEISAVTWTVNGRELILRPLTAAAAPTVAGATPRDLGSLVALAAIERLGGSIDVDGESLVVRL